MVGWNKANASAILILNFLLGWTLIGWVVALVWACTVEKNQQQNVRFTNENLSKGFDCNNCSYSSNESHYYCPRCTMDNEGFTVEQNKKRFEKVN